MTYPLGRQSGTQNASQLNSTTASEPLKGANPTASVVDPNWGAGVTDRVVDTLTTSAVTALKTAAPSDIELIPGRYPDAVSLPTMLTRIGKTAEGQAAIGRLLEGIKLRTGVDVPADVRAAAIANPALIADAFEVTPAQLSSGVLALNAAYLGGKVKAPEPSKPLLPQHFDFANLDSLDAPRPIAEMKQLAPGLLQGDLPSKTSDAQVKTNRVMAEVFDRLANNASTPDAEKFSVTFNGNTFTKVDDFVLALKAGGYNVDVRFDSRIANFANLKTLVEGSNPPKYLDVPAPLMVKTGVRDRTGKEARVPATHSEMVISISSGPDVKGPKFDSDIKFFQGISGTGFVPANVWADPSWCGRKTTARLWDNDAVMALKYAGAFTDLVTSSARKEHLYADGYGMTGVCNDSVAIVQQAVMGEATQYPLVMRDGLLLGTLNARLHDANKADDAIWAGLKKAIQKVPSDARTPDNVSHKSRALISIPWAVGEEPFASTETARRILSE